MEKERKERTEIEIKKLKEKYEILRKKYDLPEFDYLNQNFEIEDVCVYDTELVLKKIRKQVSEKIYYNLRIFESLLNPSNAPLFVFNIIKSLDNAEKELINDLYKKLGEYEIEIFGLEASYDEKKEAEFLKSFSSFWKDNSVNLEKLYSSLKKSYNQGIKKQDKSYFG